MKTPTPPYNGWIIVNSNQLSGPYATNYHVVEAVIKIDVFGKRIVEKCKGDTLCRQDLNSKVSIFSGPFLTSEVSQVRNELARMQNSHNETCGTCVSEFYADK